MKKLKDHRSKQLGGWLSSALSVAAALSGSPAYAEDALSVSDSMNSIASANSTSANSTSANSTPSNLTFESNALRLSDFASSSSTSGNLLIANFNVDADQAVLNREGDRIVSDNSNLDQTVLNHEAVLNDQSDRGSDIPNESLPHTTESITVSASEEPVDSAELTLPESLPAEFSTEASELVPLNSIAQANNPTPPSESTSTTASSRNWQFSVEPYFFAPFHVNADVTVSGRRTSLDLDLGDILNFDRVFDAGLRFEAQNDRLGLILDGFYVFAEDSGNLGRTFSSGSIFQFAQQTSPGRLQEFVQQFDPLQLQQLIQIGQQIGLNTPIRISADGTVSVRQIVVDAAVSYRVVETSLDSSNGNNFYPRLAIAPIAGVRMNSLRQTVEVDGIQINGREIPDRALPPLDREFRFSRTLVEPLLGAQFDLALSEQWSLGLRGDVSGFNIGARRNFTWNLILGTQYNFSTNFALQLAYRFNHFEFETGEGLRETELSLSQNGLLLNAIFRF